MLIPEMGAILAQVYSFNNTVRTFIYAQLLLLISSTKRLDETPFMWLLSRLHKTVEHRQRAPTSRLDLLKLDATSGYQRNH